MKQDEVYAGLEQLFQQRPHGATSLAGFQFQLLYSLDRFLDLASEENQITRIRFEGIEDVDVWRGNSRTFIQVKSSKNIQSWSWLEKILDKFAEVYRRDKTAHFRIVTNFEFTGDLKSLYLFTVGSETTLPSKLTLRLSSISERVDLTQSEVEDLLKRISFEITDRPSLIASILQKLISRFEIHTGNEKLYFRVLSSKVDDLAIQRSTCYAEDLYRIRQEIDDWISVGATNPAVEYGWIEQLDFKSDLQGNEEDYYLGKGARPAHILANVDAQRPKWIEAIRDSLSDTPICIVRSSSGQGKSTLLYRYAYTYFDHHTTFVLKKIQDSDEIVPLRRFLESRLQLGLPVLVLVNDLTERVKLWHELAIELAGHPISFLIASREENWHRYFGNLHNLRWETVTPELSLQEAKDIYRQFEKQGRIASNVRSAAWAYEKVAAKKLLIEFIFLITQGQMLSERLEEQIATFERLGEDPGKLTVLRLASLAQVLDVRISAANILTATDFRSDPQQTVKSLIGEYVEVTADGYIEGLHFVRSEHLMAILHDPLPINSSVLKLFDLVSNDDLPVLVRSAFSHPAVQYRDSSLVSSLTSRTAHNVTLTVEVVRGLFRADEIRYLRENKQIIDEFIECFGSASLVTYFTNANMPARDEFDIFEAMASTNLMSRETLAEMKASLQLMPARDVSKRVSKSYLQEAIRVFNLADLIADLPSARRLLIWTRYYELSFKTTARLFRDDEWQQLVFVKPIVESADLMYLLWEEYPDKYKEFVRMHLKEIIELYRRKTDTLLVNVREDDVYIEFVADETSEIHDAQTMRRLHILMRLLPHCTSYCSQGLYPLSPMDRLQIDDSKKQLTKDALHKDIAEINSLYTSELEALFNPDSLFDWLHYWHELREAIQDFVNALIERHESMLQGRGATELEPVLDYLSPLLFEKPRTPNLIKARFAEQCKKLNEWRNSISKFVHLYLDNRKLRQDHRYLHNLFVAYGQLQDMQAAFEVIVHSGASTYEPKIAAEEERKSYRHLYDLFGFWLSVPENRILPPGVRPRSAVSAWKKKERRELKSKLVSAFQGLLDKDAYVHLPVDYLEEPPQKNLCFGIELQDGTRLLEHAEVICRCLGNADVFYDFVYVLPVINSRPLQSIVFRIHSDIAKKIVAGEQLGDEIAVWPVETPDGFFQSASGIDREVLPEWQYYLDAQGILYRLHGLRNEVAYVGQRVEDELSAWRTQLFSGIEQRLVAVEKDALQLIESASRFRVQVATVEWDCIWQYFAESVESKKISVFDVLGFEPVAAGDDEELMLVYGKYVNHEYLYSDT